MLILARNKGQSIIFDDSIKLTVLECSGQEVEFRIERLNSQEAARDNSAPYNLCDPCPSNLKVVE